MALWREGSGGMSELSIESDLHIFSDDNNLGANSSGNNIPNKTTLNAIEKAEKGIGLNGPFEGVEEMLYALKVDTDK